MCKSKAEGNKTQLLNIDDVSHLLQEIPKTKQKDQENMRETHNKEANRQN